MHSRLAALTLLIAVITGGCGGSGGGTTTTTRTLTNSAPAVIAAPQTSTRAARGSAHRHARLERNRAAPAGAHGAAVTPGALPQTARRPSARTPGFRAEMAALWSAIVHGAVRPGLAAFFPERAYLQVKAIADPAADWRDRLVAGYALDIAAAHRVLRPGARLVGVRVVASYAHWVPPGVCANRVGYWEVPNARVVYRQGPAVRSFGIASMISWRGVWYVVHLGAVVRSGTGGVVDAPAAGPGVSAASSTC